MEYNISKGADDMQPVYTLKNGVTIPKIGYGTWQIPEGNDVIEAVKTALKVGYRHIDTAMIYRNEEGVGQALIESKIPRNEIFLTTKVWNTDQGYEATLQAFETSLKKLKTDYLDLYLIHWPAVNIYEDSVKMNQETWRAMEKLYEEGKVRAIGVCNFFEHHMEALLKTAKIHPMVNQIEINPGNPATELVKFCQAKDILVQAYSPMMKGKVLAIPLLEEIANKYHKTIPQVVLRWLIDRGINPLSKSVTTERMKANFDLFDFTLTEEEHERIDALKTMGRVGTHPDEAKF